MLPSHVAQLVSETHLTLQCIVSDQHLEKVEGQQIVDSIKEDTLFIRNEDIC